MRILRFIFFLAILFFICFWLGGGSSIITEPSGNIPTTVQAKVKETIPKDISLTETTDKITTYFDRALRIVNLPQAIDKSINRNTNNYVALEDMGMPIQQAIIAVEDNRFYSHSGFDIEAMLRASLVNLQFGQIEEGASTITQQLVKNLFLSQDRSFSRKAEEFILAIDMEIRYPKEKILELYLNTIYFGSGFYGIYDASIGYFGKQPSELSLAEATMLAGLPNAPSLYSPYVDFQAAKHRQAIVLETMIKSGYINPSTAQKIKQEKIWLAK